MHTDQKLSKDKIRNQINVEYKQNFEIENK